MSLLSELFLTFAKIGLFTFGGGYAMIALIENACVEKKQWITHDEMMNITVIAESTPGPIAINCATYVGYKQKGMAGAAAATVGMVLPSFVIIFLISLFLDNFLEIRWIAHAFQGIKIAVGILILAAACRMIRKMQKKPLPLTIMGLAFLSMLLADVLALRLSTINLMLAAGTVSLLLFLRKQPAMKGSGMKDDAEKGDPQKDDREKGDPEKDDREKDDREREYTEKEKPGKADPEMGDPEKGGAGK